MMLPEETIVRILDVEITSSSGVPTSRAWLASFWVGLEQQLWQRQAGSMGECFDRLELCGWQRERQGLQGDLIRPLGEARLYERFTVAVSVSLDLVLSLSLSSSSSSSSTSACSPSPASPTPGCYRPEASSPPLVIDVFIQGIITVVIAIILIIFIILLLLLLLLMFFSAVSVAVTTFLRLPHTCAPAPLHSCR